LADLLIYRDLILAGQARRRIPDAAPQQVLAPIPPPKRAAPRSAGGNAGADVEIDPVM
jgi:hypothetical protein